MKEIPFKVKCIDAELTSLEYGGIYTVVGYAFDYTEYRIAENVATYMICRFEVVEEEVGQPAAPHNKYMREVKPGVWCDVYDVLRAWKVEDPCLQHLLKKALASGQRGHKDLKEDLDDILASAKRAVELHAEWSKPTNDF